MELRGVHKHYEESGQRHPVLSGIDLRVDAGEAVAIVGRSGSGKSTLLNLIGALDEPSAGDIVISGTSLRGLDETGRALLRRERIGFVFQFFNLIPTLTIEENLRLPLELGNAGVENAGDRAGKWLDAIGLGDRAASFPEMLSGGEQQRVAVARALVHGPALLLADEPTGNLDADTAEIVLNLIARMCRDSGSTLIIATHSLEQAARFDRRYRIDQGRLTAC
ncbi:MAG: ABC transporter ATP-binding protein [Gammaproteobacteria bacterium]